MGRRLWVAVAGGALAALLVFGVAAGAYRAGQHHDAVVTTVGDSQVVRVVGDHWGWGPPWPGFFLFPLFGILLVVLLVSAARRSAGGWGGPPPWVQRGGPQEAFEEWHRRAHQGVAAEDRPAPPTG